MSAFTRLYYANRGLSRVGIEDSYLYPFEDAPRDPPVPIGAEDPSGDPAPGLHREERAGAAIRHADPRHSARNPT